MKIRIGIAIVATALLGAVALGSTLSGWEVFVGYWVNVLPSESPARVIISGSDQFSATFQGFGSCVPTDCEWPIVPLWIFGEHNPAATEATTATCSWDAGFKEVFATIHVHDLGNVDMLVVDLYSRFSDGSGRSNYHAIGYLAKAPSDTCDCTGPDLNCDDFDPPAAAQACYEYCKWMGYGDVFILDGDNDGIVCE
ncbi:hypothetical protein ACFLS5_03020 [Candidatus Bipolaricaulota bacterium]